MGKTLTIVKTVNVVEDSDIGAVDNTLVVQGDRIRTNIYDSVKLLFDVTANDSTGLRVALFTNKTATGGSDYHPASSALYITEISDAYEVTYDLEAAEYITIKTYAILVGATPAAVTIKAYLQGK